MFSQEYRKINRERLYFFVKLCYTIARFYEKEHGALKKRHPEMR